MKRKAAARNGDEEAMENLTMEEMDTYSMISNRIVHEDILSIVDSYFMPYGIQCDQYSILGEIIEYHTVKNNITDEELVQMTVECNNSCIFRIEENIRAEEYRL